MSDTVQDLKHGVLTFNGWHFDDADARVDALIAAVRAEERARCIAIMDDVCQYEILVERGAVRQECHGVFVRKSDILAALTGADT